MPLRVRVALLLASCLLAATRLYSADRAITIGMVIDGSTQAERQPLRDYLASAMQRPVNLSSPDTYRQTLASLGNGTFDFACLGGLMYIRARAQYGVIPLVQRMTDLKYHTVFITGADSPINSLGDLKGRQFAFGDVDSTSGHLMPLLELRQAGINPETDLKLRFSGSHLATAALVATGVVDAGAIDKTVFDFLVRSGKVDSNRVRIFYTSKPYVDYVWVARKDVPADERERFARALLALKKGADDSILNTLRAQKFVVANDREYETMRQVAHELGMF